MSYNHILTLTPEFGIEESIEFRTNVTDSESGKEHRDALWDEGIREYKLTVRFLTKTAMDLIWNFFIARHGSFDYFLTKIEQEYEQINEAVDTGDGVVTEFLLDKFPVDTASNHSCSVADVTNTDYLLRNDFNLEKSYITFNNAYSGAIVVSYEYYFKVRFKEDKLTRQLAAYKLLHAGITLKEVRWTSYGSTLGNSSSSSMSSSSSSSSSSSLSSSSSSSSLSSSSSSSA